MKPKKPPIQKINLSFDQYTDAGFGEKAGAIYDGVNENPDFTNPTPGMEMLNTARLGYLSALDKASTRSKNDVALKNAARLLLTDLLTDLGNFVTLRAKGDVTKLIASRFDLRKKRESKPELQQPKNLVMADGMNPGMILMSVDAAKGARSYSFEITPGPVMPDSVWIKIVATTRKCTFSNLESGKKMWGRVGAVGVKNQFVYSVVLSRTVQ